MMSGMKKQTIGVLLILSLLIQSGRALAELPDLGDVSEASISRSDEARIGQDAMQAMVQDGEVSEDPEITRYLDSLGARLAAGVGSAGFRFSFFVANDRSINAFAMPGGYIGVNKGLLLCAQSEGELASVLGHEMAHVTQRHLARTQAKGTSSQLTMLATVAAAALASMSRNSDAVVGTLSAGVGLTVANQLAFSRDNEREADRVGMQYLAAAGFDVRNMPDFFQRLQQSEHLNGGDTYAFLRTHPVTIERISEAQNRATSAPVRMLASSTGFFLVREKIRVEGMQATEASEYYLHSLSHKLYLNQGAQWYGLARARMGLGEVAGARQALTEARHLLGPEPMLSGLDAEIALKARDWEHALAAYRAGLLLFPDDQALEQGMISLLVQHGDRSSALKAIKARQARHPSDAWSYRQESMIYVDKDPLRYHAALGNALYYEKKIRSAAEQFHLASQAAGEDFYLRSSIEARMRELDKLLADEKAAGVKRPQGQ
jgi:predicted Zn-dependent protease